LTLNAPNTSHPFTVLSFIAVSSSASAGTSLFPNLYALLISSGATSWPSPTVFPSAFSGGIVWYVRVMLTRPVASRPGLERVENFLEGGARFSLVFRYARDGMDKCSAPPSVMEPRNVGVGRTCFVRARNRNLAASDAEKSECEWVAAKARRRGSLWAFWGSLFCSVKERAGSSKSRPLERASDRAQRVEEARIGQFRTSERENATS